MTVKEALAQLKSLGNEKVRARNTKHGAGPDQFGVPLGDVRKLAEKIKTDHTLALALWETGNLDARLLAILLLKPKVLSRDEMDQMVRSARFAQLADWLNSYAVKNHPDKESLRQSWMKADDPWAARAGWSLTSGRIAREPDGLDVPALLDRIESEMGTAPPEVQWTMNSALATAASTFPGCAREQSRSAKSWESIATIRFPRAALPPLPQSGSTRWCGARSARRLGRNQPAMQRRHHAGGRRMGRSAGVHWRRN